MCANSYSYNNNNTNIIFRYGLLFHIYLHIYLFVCTINFCKLSSRVLCSPSRSKLDSEAKKWRYE